MQMALIRLTVQSTALISLISGLFSKDVNNLYQHLSAKLTTNMDKNDKRLK